MRSAMDRLFLVIVGTAICLGGGEALKGMPAFLRALRPPIAAEARSPTPATTLALSGFEGPVQLRPVVLAPISTHERPVWLKPLRETRRDVASSPAAGVRPEIAIVVDDLGVDAAATERAIALPAAVSLSFLPYGTTTPALARQAERAGHEVLVHVPMEPEGLADPGPMALRLGLGAEENVRRLDWALGRVPGFAGINNHMGSRFTADRASLVPVMAVLAARHAYFLDSRTTAATAVVPVARMLGVASTGRDVFLDDNEAPSAVAAQMFETVHKARLAGVAIAIGHPHPATLAFLSHWLSHAAAENVDLVPLGRAVRDKTERERGAQRMSHST